MEFVVLLGFGLSSEVKEFKEYYEKGQIITFVIILVSLWLISLFLRILYYTTLHMWSSVIVAGKTPIPKKLKNNKLQEFFQYVFMSRNIWICGSLKHIQTTLFILPKNIIESISSVGEDLNTEFKKTLQNKCSFCSVLKFLLMLVFSLVFILLLLVSLVLCIPILTVLFIWNLTAKNGFITVTVDDTQLWKLEGNKLTNKAHVWTSYDDWRLPEPGNEDNIENTSKNTFLKIFNAELDTMTGLGKIY
jgi:hypothetical protein